MTNNQTHSTDTELREQILYEIPRTRCESGCDGKGTYGEYDEDGDPVAAQCQYCWQVRIPQAERIMNLITAKVTEARIDELTNLFPDYRSHGLGISYTVYNEWVRKRIAELQSKEPSND